MQNFFHKPLIAHVLRSLLHLFLNKQYIFDTRPENCLSFSKKSPQKVV